MRPSINVGSALTKDEDAKLPESIHTYSPQPTSVSPTLKDPPVKDSPMSMSPLSNPDEDHLLVATDDRSTGVSELHWQIHATDEAEHASKGR